MTPRAIRKHSRDELVAFLRAVDAALEAPVNMTIVGGTAVSFFDPTHATTDLDTLMAAADWTAFVRACEAARGVTGLDIEIQNAAIHPLVPERHDLAMAKIARGYENDLQAVTDIHRAEPLSLSTLVERYVETYVTGRREGFKLAFLDLVTRVFGESEATRLDQQLEP